MRNEKRLRLLLFIIVSAVHILLILFFAVNVATTPMQVSEHARLMRVFDIEEEPPPRPLPPREEIPVPRPPVQELHHQIPVVEAIAETMIETETEPDQIVVAPGTIIEYSGTGESGGSGTSEAADDWDSYLPMHKISQSPGFNESEIMAALVYPPIAQRSGIEGRVILELFVDRTGLVQQIRILQENPQDRGFGEAAVRAFTGRRGTPARAEGEPVSSRFRYPVSFRIR